MKLGRFNETGIDAVRGRLPQIKVADDGELAIAVEEETRRLAWAKSGGIR